MTLSDNLKLPVIVWFMHFMLALHSGYNEVFLGNDDYTHVSVLFWIDWKSECQPVNVNETHWESGSKDIAVCEELLLPARGEFGDVLLVSFSTVVCKLY